MAFVRNNSPRVGEIRVLKRDVSAMKGTILAGSRVEVIGESYRGWEIKDLDSGEVIGETMGFDIFRD